MEFLDDMLILLIIFGSPFIILAIGIIQIVKKELIGIVLCILAVIFTVRIIADFDNFLFYTLALWLFCIGVLLINEGIRAWKKQDKEKKSHTSGILIIIGVLLILSFPAYLILHSI